MCMRSAIVLLSLCVLAACSGHKQENTGKTEPINPVLTPVADDSLLVTDSAWGQIDRNTDISGLKKIFGADAITDERICGAECIDSVDVTFIHKDQPSQLTVYWDDSAYHKTIAFIQADKAGSPYHSSAGIHIGSSLRDLLAVNGAQIDFSGFDWDYGGSIESLNRGALENSAVNYSLGIGDEQGADDLSGDRKFTTNMPVVKKALDKIRVTEIRLVFDR